MPNSPVSRRALRGAAEVGMSHRIPSLDGIRAVAILAVLWGHSSATVGSLPAWLDPVWNFLPTGGFGVQIFFVLSGFLITTLLVRERQKTGTVSLKTFYIRRAYRILPAFYAFLAVVVALVALKVIDVSGMVILASALFVRDYMPSGGSWWLGHTWSLSIEEQFYLLWPLVFIKLKAPWVRRLLWIGILASPLIRIATWLFIPPLRNGIEIMFHTRADALMVGCMLAMLYANPGFRAKAEAALSKGLGWAALAWLVTSVYLQHVVGDGWSFTVGYLGDALAIAVVIVWLVQRPNTPAGKVLNWAPVRHLGILSYSLYLWQQLFLTPKNETFLGWFPLNILAAILVAELSYRLVEQPFLRLRQRRQAKAKAEAKTAAPAHSA